MYVRAYRSSFQKKGKPNTNTKDARECFSFATHYQDENLFYCLLLLHERKKTASGWPTRFFFGLAAAVTDL